MLLRSEPVLVAFVDKECCSEVVELEEGEAEKSTGEATCKTNPRLEEKIHILIDEDGADD